MPPKNFFTFFFNPFTNPGEFSPFLRKFTAFMTVWNFVLGVGEIYAHDWVWLAVSVFFVIALPVQDYFLRWKDYKVFAKLE